jgi:hypothetical protein
MYNKQHLISLMEYIGIWLIGWSITHGFFSGTRSLITAIIGILLFTIAEYLKWWQKDYLKLIIWSLVFSIAIGMVSGGFQHFLDSPMRSLWVIPVGWFVSTLIFPYKEWFKDYHLIKSLALWWAISIWLLWILYGSMHLIPESYFEIWWHHGDEINHEITTLSSWSITSGQVTNETTQVIITQPNYEDDPNHH